MMALEGLSAVLEKQPIIPTYKARDLSRIPESVEASYERHVRSYIPLAADAGSDEGLGVEDFQRKLIRMVKESRAPLGYIAAEYGYGKTSTGLFLWEKARKENLLAVPPFSFDAMEDLVTAVAGWVRFAVNRVHPGLGERADVAFERYHHESVEGLARSLSDDTGRQFDQVLHEMELLDQQGRLKLRLGGLGYVDFLSEMADLAREAGYLGLLVVADELQQYIEHEDVSSAREPIADLFDFITAILTRRGRLACGVVFLLPNKELGFINEQRGDLIQRIKDDRLALDLALVYGPDFASRLWGRLSEEFDFGDVAAEVISPDTLRAIGEIASRPDLASGPRTVVDVLKVASQRFICGARSPYSPLDLVASFEHNAIAFDGVSKIQMAVRQALAHELVRGNELAERAVRLMAAFPTSGLTEDLQEANGVREAADDLNRLAGGELVALRGGGLDHQGKVVKAGLSLMALQPIGAQISWLKGTIRNFRRDYYLGSRRVQDQALDGFRVLLVDRIFSTPNWKLELERPATIITQNRGLLFRGVFPSAARQFPDRVIYCRLLSPGETVRDTPPDHDLLIDFALQVQIDQSSPSQRRDAGRLLWLGPNHARVELNLLHRDPDANYVELNPGFESIVAPYDLNPLLVLSLYSVLKQSLTAGRVPGTEESNVRDIFLPALLTAALRDLFNSELGKTGDPIIPTADVRFVETLTLALCQRTYADQYVTLMAITAWRSALQQYRGALDRIDHPLIRCGQERLSATKKQVADLFNRTNPALDNFIQTFPQLVAVDEPFRGDSPGAVRFTLHPLERRIQLILSSSEEKQVRLHPRTRQSIEVPAVAISDLWRELKPLGYRQDEMDVALELLETRRIIQRDSAHGQVIGLEPDVPPLEEVCAALEEVQSRTTMLRPVLDPAFLAATERMLSPFLSAIRRGNGGLLPNQLINAKRTVERASADLSGAAEQRRKQMVDNSVQLASVSMDDSRIASSLSAAAGGGLFADELNIVRVALRQEVTSLRTRIDSARAVGREVSDELAASPLSDQVLVQTLDRLQAARTILSQTAQAKDTLAARIANYRDAERLLQEASELKNEKLLLLGDGVSGESRDLDRWTRDIKGWIYTQRVESLGDVESWRARFREIKDRVAAYEQSMRDAFGERQQLLRSILTGHFKVPSETLGAPLTYNPADPEGSYRLVEQQFKETLRSVRQTVISKLEEIRRSARDVLVPEVLATLTPEDRARATEEMREVENSVDEVRRLMTREFARLSELAERGATSEAETLGAQAQSVLAAAQPVNDLFTRVQSVRRLLQETAMTSEERLGYDILTELSQQGEVEFVDFQQKVKLSAGAQDPWVLLKSLSAKSRVRVRIQVLRQ